MAKRKLVVKRLPPKSEPSRADEFAALLKQKLQAAALSARATEVENAVSTLVREAFEGRDRPSSRTCSTPSRR